MQRAVFLDKDGVIVQNIPVPEKHARTPWTWEEFAILPGVVEGLKMLKGAGYLRILVSNQPDVTLGQMPEDMWHAMQKKVEALGFDDVYICHHHPKVSVCECRKPLPKMVFDAAKKWNIDLANSFMVGDMQTDVSTGRAAGCKVILIDYPENTMLSCDYRAKDLLDAARQILKL